MYSFAVLFVIFTKAAPFEIESVLPSNFTDFKDEEKTQWPLFPLNNSSPPSDQSNEVMNEVTLAHLTAIPSKDNIEGTTRYVFGKWHENDRMIGYLSDSKSWITPQDVTVNLRYPSSGQGAIVTCVDIIVGRSTNLGDAKVVGGGIGQRSIAIVLTAQSTVWWSYTAFFYAT